MDWRIYFVQGAELLFLGLGTYFDIKDQEIPGGLLWMFGSLGILMNVIWKYQNLKNIVLGISIGGLFLVIGWITNESIGYGDGLGLAVIGLMEGWQGLIPLIIFSFLLSGVYGAWKVVGVKASKEEHLPFYPFLLLAFLGAAWI